MQNAKEVSLTAESHQLQAVPAVTLAALLCVFAVNLRSTPCRGLSLEVGAFMVPLTTVR